MKRFFSLSFETELVGIKKIHTHNKNYARPKTKLGKTSDVKCISKFRYIFTTFGLKQSKSVTFRCLFFIQELHTLCIIHRRICFVISVVFFLSSIVVWLSFWFFLSLSLSHYFCSSVDAILTRICHDILRDKLKTEQPIVLFDIMVLYLGSFARSIYLSV